MKIKTFLELWAMVNVLFLAFVFFRLWWRTQRLRRARRMFWLLEEDRLRRWTDR